MRRAVLLGVLIGVGTMGMAAKQATAPASGNGAAQPPTADDRKDTRQPVRDQGRRRRQHRGIRHGAGRRARRHQARRLGPAHHGPGPLGHGQTRDDDHQHAHARRSHRQQRVLSGVSRSRRPGEHEDQHGEDGRLQGREGAVPPGQDVQGQAHAQFGRRSDRPLLLRRRPHQRRQHRRLPGASRRTRRRSVRAQSNAAHRRQQRRQWRRVSGNPEESGPGSRAWIRSSQATTSCCRGARWPNMANSTSAFLDATKAAFKAGKSAEDAVAQFKMPDKFKDYNMNGVKDNVTKIYAELKK